MATTSSAPSPGSASSTSAPAPKAPEAAIVTCQASPASSSTPSHSTRHGSGLRSAPAAALRPRRRAGRAAPSRTRACSAAGAGSPALATFTNGRSPFIQPSSSGRSTRAVHREPARRDEVVRELEPAREVVGGAGRRARRAEARRRPAAAATGATLPSPPATTTRSSRLAARSRASSVRRASEAARPRAPNVRAARVRATRRITVSRPLVCHQCDRHAAAPAAVGVFPDVVPAMLLGPMGAQARVFVTRRLPGDALERLAAEHDVEVWPERAAAAARRSCSRARPSRGPAVAAHRPHRRRADRAAPRLRAISNYAVGVDNVDVEAATARGIPVGNTPDVLTDSPPTWRSR